MPSDEYLINRLVSAAHAGRLVKLYPETALRLADALREVIGRDRRPPRRVMDYEPLGFTVETWSTDGNRLLDTLARSKNLLIGRAAFEECGRQRPTDRVMLRHGAHVIEDRPADRTGDI